jgi:hypothetical protein
MGRGREPVHVATDLGDDPGGGERADPGMVVSRPAAS